MGSAVLLRDDFNGAALRLLARQTSETGNFSGGLATFSVEPRAIQIGRSGQSRASGQSHCISIT